MKTQQLSKASYLTSPTYLSKIMEVIRKELETGTIMFVPVPDDASDLTLPKIGIVDLYFRTDDEDYEDGYISVTIPQGNWQVLGDSKQLTEEDLVGVIPSVLMFHGREYLDFNPPPYNPAYRFSTALEAFSSLKESLQLGKGKHIVLFEAKK